MNTLPPSSHSPEVHLFDAYGDPLNFDNRYGGTFYKHLISELQRRGISAIHRHFAPYSELFSEANKLVETQMQKSTESSSLMIFVRVQADDVLKYLSLESPYEDSIIKKSENALTLIQSLPHDTIIAHADANFDDTYPASTGRKINTLLGIRSKTGRNTGTFLPQHFNRYIHYFLPSESPVTRHTKQCIDALLEGNPFPKPTREDTSSFMMTPVTPDHPSYPSGMWQRG